MDTEICSYAMAGRPPSRLVRLSESSPESIQVSVITLAQFFYGLRRRRVGPQKLLALDELTRTFAIESWPKAAASIYGELRADLERLGAPIGDHDVTIAAHAIASDLILVTNNVRHFQRVGASLRLENWTV